MHIWVLAHEVNQVYCFSQGVRHSALVQQDNNTDVTWNRVLWTRNSEKPRV